ncbi:hypothetical protein HBI56_050280 [Parastagonospora nodorum]|uniref:Uncharacterized protein n=1 Tax=Phaeosphaeria nodorum (strain SN15 / ATCC MYA-4574 / FGSC 10173) TaxID=321614 RepID=A0A7U2ESE0_PHANO|nr:hypothetical protein HBH56_063210 [Parastagonospora nodorum]QRC92124.1 hypothetical protein JI435_401990 [Parastagonospora nodorum SN15]KAH3931136.1 hypothetical protein HBH54_107150 [Parastagonospora nodorum]KAH3954151.1 hypothetical protein HBH53_022090 [Parastagonospora nodorum]KAH3968086.1 hypothetical protein HBH51_131590 [Parastagonospora nodorum]
MSIRHGRFKGLQRCAATVRHRKRVALASKYQTVNVPLVPWVPLLCTSLDTNFAESVEESSSTVLVFPCRHSTIQIIVLLSPAGTVPFPRHHSFALPSHRDWPPHTVRGSTAVSGAFKPDLATIRVLYVPDKELHLAPS